MTESEFKRVCGRIVLNEDAKEKIYQNICEDVKSTGETGKRVDLYSRKKRSIIRQSVRWAAVIVTVCLIMENMAAFAVEKVIQRFRVPGEVYIEEGKGIMIGDREQGVFYEDMTEDEREEYDQFVEDVKNGVIQSAESVELYYDTIEEAAIDLNLSLALPDITRLGFEQSDLTVSKTEEADDEDGYIYHTFYMALGYQKTAEIMENFEMSIWITHIENTSNHYFGGSTFVINMEENNIQNMEEYTNSSGGTFALYEYRDEEDRGTIAVFSYTDRYWISKLTHTYAIDRFYYELDFGNMDTEQIYEVLECISF